METWASTVKAEMQAKAATKKVVLVKSMMNEGEGDGLKGKGKVVVFIC